jgi:hypothetical protein
MHSPTPSARLALTHQRVGWSAFVFFSLVGILLEVLLAWKAPFLVDATHAERRHLLRLGHAHGTLLSLLQLAFCTALPHVDTERTSTRLASLFLRVSLLLLPSGFLLGGLSAQEGDPGLPIVLVPLGGLLLVASVMILTRELFRPPSPGRS